MYISAMLSAVELHENQNLKYLIERFTHLQASSDF